MKVKDPGKQVFSKPGESQVEVNDPEKQGFVKPGESVALATSDYGTVPERVCQAEAVSNGVGA